MALAERQATATWQGNLRQGSGSFNSGSGALRDQAITWAARTEQPGGKTSPEELIAAAHASCFSMAFSSGLDKGGHAPEQLRVTATCVLDRVDGNPTITTMRLDVTGRVPGIDQATFDRLAHEAGQNCPVSRALKGSVKIEVNAKLES